MRSTFYLILVIAFTLGGIYVLCYGHYKSTFYDPKPTKLILTRVNRVFNPKMPNNAVMLKKPEQLLVKRNLTVTRVGAVHTKPLKIQNLHCKYIIF